MGTDMVQVIKPDGRLVDPSYVPRLSSDELKKLYRAMLQTRLFDERALMLQRQGRIGFSVPSTGQEAIAACGMALDKKDWVFPAYREHAVALMRGMPVETMMNQLFGTGRDLVKGHQMPFHFTCRDINYVSISSPIGTQISHAVGAAYAAKLKKEKTVTMTFFGDGGTSLNDFHAGMNFAAVWKVPTIFYCSNNQYAISVPLEKQTAQPTIAEKATAYGMPGVRVDGNDPLAIYQVVCEAIERGREGKGPTLIEAYTFRMGSHTSSDDASVYCPKEKFEEWAKKDPIQRFKTYLIEKKFWSEKEDEACVEAIKSEIAEAIEKARQEKPPSLSSIFSDVYAEMPKSLKKQQTELLEEAKRKGGFKDSSEAFPL